jgi:Nitrate and nitrite sensing/HAMP domain
MLRDAGVRGKLFAVLAIPALLLVVASGWLVGGQVQSARQAGQIEAVTDVGIQLNRVVHSLQLERSVSLNYLQNSTANQRAAMLGQRQDTNAQLSVLRAKILASPIADMSASIGAAAARSTEGHNELVGARKSIDAGRFFSTETDVFYGKIIATDLQLPGVIAASASPELAQRLQAEGSLSTTIEYASHERDLIQLAYLKGTVNEAEFGQASALAAQQRVSLQDFERSAPAGLFSALDTKLAASDVTQLDTSRRHLTDLLKGRSPDVPGSKRWLQAANPRIASLTTSEGQLVTDIANVAASLQSAEQLKAGIFGAGAIFGLVLAGLFAGVLAQRITLPLRRLTLAAGEIGEELPHMVERMQQPGVGPGVVVEPIPVESDDEIGRLAVAFNTVNEVTLRVARDQAALRASIAEMFVNVARRNQVLLGRQLAQLDKMEAREEDPDLLKNLFRLDHLATRMRRNAESLLVLAGIDSTRRLRQAMPLSDVIRTAVGEIEAYERVDTAVADDPEVSGRYALSIAHLLAELLENATVFSNPGTRVVVATAMTGHGFDVTITDYGLGMTEEEIVEANESIAHPPLAEIAVSQRLGLFVVGRIAARLGVTASLRQGRSAGTVVTVGLPLDVFEGLQVEEPVTADATADAFAASAPVDEPASDGELAQAGVLVGALAASDSAVAVEAGLPSAPVSLFNPSEVALSRLPQVDVAALMADAEADSRLHAIAAPTAPASTGRRLLPRRSRSDEPVEVVPVDDVAVAEVLGDEIPVHVAPVDVEQVGDETIELAAVEVAALDVAPVDSAPVDAVDAADELMDTDQSDTDPTDREEPGVGSHSRRRGSFFQRRRRIPVAAPVELPQRDEHLQEPAADADAHVASDEPFTDKLGVYEPELPEVSWYPAATAPALDEPAFDEPAFDEPVEQIAADEQEEIVEQIAADEPEEFVAAAEPAARRGLFGRRRQPTVHQVDPLEHAPDQVPADDLAAEFVDPQPVDALFAPAEQVVTEPVHVAPPGLFAPFDDQPVAFESTITEPEYVDPGFVHPEHVDTDNALADALDEEPDAVVPTEKSARRRRLFGRRTQVADEPAAFEPSSDETPSEPVAETFAAEPAVAEELFAPAAEAAVTEPPSWQLAEEPIAFGTVETAEPPTVVQPIVTALTEPFPVEPVDVEPFVFEPFSVEPVTVEALDPVPELAPDSGLAAEYSPDEFASEELPVEELAPAAEPARRRGRFGRRQHSAEPVPVEPVSVEPVAVEPVAESAEPADAADLFAPAADAFVPAESFAAHLPAPVAEPEPTPPAAPLYFAPAIDILPGKPMGRRSKRGKSAPAAQLPVPAAAPVTPYAPSVFDSVAPPPSFGAPVTTEPVRVPAPVHQPEHRSVAPSAPPRQASAAAPVSQPAAPAPMSELDQMALNAELHKSALSELRGLYEPSVNQAAAPSADAAAGLIRRQRRAVEAVVEPELPDVPARARDASEVRGMLTGFRAGVERGRTAPSEASEPDADPTDDSTD